jgi:hypothetical protein
MSRPDATITAIRTQTSLLYQEGKSKVQFIFSFFSRYVSFSERRERQKKLIREYERRDRIRKAKRYLLDQITKYKFYESYPDAYARLLKYTVTLFGLTKDETSSLDTDLVPHGRSKISKKNNKNKLDTKKWKIEFMPAHDFRDLEFESYLLNALIREFTRASRDMETLPSVMKDKFAKWKHSAAQYSILVSPTNNFIGWCFGGKTGDYIPFRLMPFFSGSYLATRDYFLAYVPVSLCKLDFSNKWLMHKWATQQKESNSIRFPLWYLKNFDSLTRELFMRPMKMTKRKETIKPLPTLYLKGRKVPKDDARRIMKTKRAAGVEVLVMEDKKMSKDTYFPFMWTDPKRERFSHLSLDSDRLRDALKRYRTRDRNHFPVNASYKKAVKHLETLRIRDKMIPHGIIPHSDSSFVDEVLTTLQGIDAEQVPFFQRSIFCPTPYG